MAQLLGEGHHRPVHRQLLALELSWHLNRPAVVSEVVFNLSHDDRYRKGDEFAAQFRVELLDGFEQSDGAHLHQVV